MARLAFLGLGVMGFPMAGHLVAKGHSVTVYNRSAAKAKLWVETYGQTSAPTPALAAAGAEVVMGADGLATGELREFVAMDLVRRLGPSRSIPLHKYPFVDHPQNCVSRALRRAARVIPASFQKVRRTPLTQQSSAFEKPALKQLNLRCLNYRK
jgi:hypothetical protein